MEAIVVPTTVVETMTVETTVDDPDAGVSPDDSPGAVDKGGESAPARMRLGGKGQDAVLARRAMNGNWGLTPAIRQSVVAAMAEIVSTSEVDRDRIAAARALIAADALDVQSDRPAPVRQSVTLIDARPGGNPEVQAKIAEAGRLIAGMATGPTAGK